MKPIFQAIVSVGDIGQSRYWLTIEHRPWAWWRWHLSFGPTYNGTIAGILICTPRFVILGHIRSRQFLKFIRERDAALAKAKGGSA